MTDQQQAYHAQSSPIRKGTTLVEAGAGTGKTYALAMLVLRSVVELRIPIEEILVVTFTKAATAELRERIRAFFSLGRNLILDSNFGGADIDPTIKEWVATIADGKGAKELLTAALADIDRASILTIHGFCQKMLVEHALVGGRPLAFELLADLAGVREGIVMDFWREHLYRLPPMVCMVLLDNHPNPEDLYSSLSKVKGQACRIEPAASGMDPAVERYARAYDMMKCWWQENGASLHAGLAKGIDDKIFKKGLAEDFEIWWQDVASYLGGLSHSLPKKISLLQRQVLVEEINRRKIADPEKRHELIASWPLPEEILAELLAAADGLVLAFRVGLAHFLQEQLGKRLAQDGHLGFDNLIEGMHEAIAGPAGGPFLESIATRYQMALIDEFQDTDSSQYQIFSTLFAGKNHYLFFIGDPKQAIYGFRGADIHSYFAAREKADRLVSLKTNYRSHKNLVEEVNRLFGGRDKPFLYQEEKLAYSPVSAAKKNDETVWIDPNRGEAAMVYGCLVPEDEALGQNLGNSEAAELCMEETIREIRALLRGQTSFKVEGKPQKISPKDIGILLRTNGEAKEYRQALADVGLQAVLASRSSVYLAKECLALIKIMAAINAPLNRVLLKTAMATPWFGLDGQQLQEIWQDEGAVAIYQHRFLSYRQLWRESGFLNMMSSFLQLENIWQNLVRLPFAERAIANCNQLLQLVQEEANRSGYGPVQLEKWLCDMHLDRSHGEESELLLESDEEAIQLVTMHGAKGLEYPIVFCPALWRARSQGRGRSQQIMVHEDGEILVDLGSKAFDERLKAAQFEERAEELRLAYVALTRAKLRCYVYWADVAGRGPNPGSFSSALGYLLFPHGRLNETASLDLLQNRGKKEGVAVYRFGANKGPTSPFALKAREGFTPRKPSLRSLASNWQLASFSSLAKNAEHPPPRGMLPAEGGDQPLTGPIELPGLPAGPGFGSLVHDLLEELDFTAIAAGGKEPIDQCQNSIKRYGQKLAAEDLLLLLQKVCCTKLVDGFSLSDLKPASCLKEMMFYYRLNPLQTDAISRILKDDPTVLPLKPEALQGFLTGFIDLTCCHQGRYYLIDYKTNMLGDELGNYSQDRLVAAMREHNYGLQYWVYSLVLHHHLIAFEPLYSFDKHFGGVLYLFLRGMSPRLPGSGVYNTRPPLAVLNQLAAVMGGQDEG